MWSAVVPPTITFLELEIPGGGPGRPIPLQHWNSGFPVLDVWAASHRMYRLHENTV